MRKKSATHTCTEQNTRSESLFLELFVCVFCETFFLVVFGSLALFCERRDPFLFSVVKGVLFRGRVCWVRFWCLCTGANANACRRRTTAWRQHENGRCLIYLRVPSSCTHLPFVNMSPFYLHHAGPSCCAVMDEQPAPMCTGSFVSAEWGDGFANVSN